MNKDANKSVLRQRFRSLRNELSPSQKKNFDQSIGEQLYQLIKNKNAQVVHTYLPVGTEINLFPLIEKLLLENITLVCPKTLKNRQLAHLTLTSLDDLETGLYQTQYPAKGKIYQGKYDVIIVPGLAFDADNYRLGYGGGYYDTFLANHPNALKIAAAYPFQLIEKVPREAHDIKLDRIVIG